MGAPLQPMFGGRSLRNLIPTLRLPEAHAPHILRAKFGGMPWGVSHERWPVCRECGERMSALAQIPVRGHLDQAGPLLGGRASAHVLHIFLCEGEAVCSSLEPDAGANSAFLLPEAALDADAETAAPDGAAVLPEAWITGWSPFDDAVPEGREAVYVSRGQFDALPDAERFPHEGDSALRTKFGGIPYWTGNGPVQAPKAPFRYLGQIDKYLRVPGTEHGHLDLATFCSDGTGYVFVDTEGAEMGCRFLVNR